MKYVRGSSLIDVVVGTALLLTVFVGLFATLSFTVRAATDNKARAGALSVARERMEFLRSIEYDALGVSSGGGTGSYVGTDTVTLNDVVYTRRTYIVYVDDPKDGLGANDANGVTEDYKKIKVEVTWQAPSGTRSVSLVSNVVPVGVEQ